MLINTLKRSTTLKLDTGCSTYGNDLLFQIVRDIILIFVNVITGEGSLGLLQLRFGH